MEKCSQNLSEKENTSKLQRIISYFEGQICNTEELLGEYEAIREDKNSRRAHMVANRRTGLEGIIDRVRYFLILQGQLKDEESEPIKRFEERIVEFRRIVVDLNNGNTEKAGTLLETELSQELEFLRNVHTNDSLVREEVIDTFSFAHSQLQIYGLMYPTRAEQLYTEFSEEEDRRLFHTYAFNPRYASDYHFVTPPSFE